MNVVFWHGYLLADTGSNIFTREVANAWVRAGHDVTLFCQDPDALRRVDPRVRVRRPAIGRHLPVFVLDRYPDLEARHVADFSASELHAYVEANVRVIRREVDGGEVDFVLANHALLGGPVAATACSDATTPFAVYVHGSELEYAIRGRPRLAALATDALDRAARVFVGSTHTAKVLRELLGEGAYAQGLARVPPGVDIDLFHPARGSMDELLRLLRAASSAAADERSPDGDAAARLEPVGRFVLYVGKLMVQKGVHLLIEAWNAIADRHPDVHLVVVGFGDDRNALEARAGDRVVFTGAMSHEQLQRLMPLADVVVVPSVLAEAFGMIAAEAASSGVVSIVADHSGLAEVAAELGDAGVTFDGTPRDLAAKLDHVLQLDEAERRARGRLARERASARWGWDAVAARLVALMSRPLGDGA